MDHLANSTAELCQDEKAGFSLTPYLESFTPTFGLGTPVFPRMSSNLHCGIHTFPKRCLWDSYFQNPSENPGKDWYVGWQGIPMNN